MHSNKPLKILQLGSPTAIYGAERWILALIKHLDPQKITSIVGVIRDDPGQDAQLCREAEKLGFQTVEFKGYGKISFSAVKALRQYIRNHEIDILHTHFYKTDIAGLLAVQGTECKIVSTPHGWSTRADYKLMCYELLDRLSFFFMDAVVPLSADILSPLKKLPGLRKKLHLITNGVDISEVKKTTDVSTEITNIKTRDQFVIGYIGQLIPRKGLKILLHALQLLNIQNSSWCLFLVGEGDQRTELEHLAAELGIAEQVHFMGFRPDRLNFLRGFDVFVLPSRLEGIPRCLMESMAAKIPIIASDIPGCNDLIIHNKTGLLFQLDNVELLAKQLREILNSPERLTTLKEAAYKTVTEKYSANRMAEEYSTLFENLRQ